MITDEIPKPEMGIFRAVGIRFKTERGFMYQVQISTDKQTWTNLGDPIEGDGSIVEIFKSIVSSQKEFFRVHVYRP